MPTNSASVTFKKKNLYRLSFIFVGILVIITLLLLSNTLYAKLQVKNEVREYKQALFESIACQYDCSVTSRFINNKSTQIPQPTCVSRCISNLKSQFNETEFSSEQLLTDALLEQLDNAVRDCRTSEEQAIDAGIIEPFFACVQANLTQLRSQYSYLS